MERAINKYNIKLPTGNWQRARARVQKQRTTSCYVSGLQLRLRQPPNDNHWSREAFSKVFQRPADSLDMKIVYDVAHNVAKVESHKIDGETKKVTVHRKGATRSFPPGHHDIPAEYRDVDNPSSFLEAWVRAAGF